jgi:hypothetical protein
MQPLVPMTNRRYTQGQRTLIAFTGKDLHQEVNAPACHAAFHDIALLAGMLLDQAQRGQVKGGESFVESDIGLPGRVLFR